MRVLCIIAMAVTILVAAYMCVAQDVWSAEWYKPDDVGTIAQYSIEMKYANESETYDHNVSRLQFMIGKFIDKDERFKLEFEIYTSLHHSEQELMGDYERDAKEIGFYIVPKYYWHTNHTNLYVGIPLGFSHLLDAENQPNFGNSGILGTFGLAIGADTPLYKKFLLRTEYRATHTSDPYNSDLGRNLHGLMIGIIYRW